MEKLLNIPLMNTKLLFFALLLCSASLAAQEQQTLFRNARVTGGFGGPIFSLSHANGQTGYGAGGGGGVVLNQFYVGLFGMGETYGPFYRHQEQLALGYGGLWLGYTVPSHKLVHLSTSLKIAGGAAGATDFEDDWDFDHHNDWPDVVFVAVPEAGLELNVSRWFRLSGTVGYRFVEGFEGWNNFGKNDLNAPVYNLTLRFGWFGGSRRVQPAEAR